MKNLFLHTLGLLFGLPVLVLGFVPTNVFAETTIFEDGFEAPTNLGNWTSSAWMATSTDSHTGSGSAAVIGGPGTQTMSRVISTEGYENLTLSFWYKADSLDSGNPDVLRLFYLLDGANHIEITPAKIEKGDDDNEWHQVTFSGFPPEAENNSAFFLRFVADLDHPINDSLWIDDFVLTGDEIEVEVLPPVVDYCANDTELTNAEFKKAREDGLITLKVRVREGWELADLEVKNETGCTAPLSLSSYKMFDTVNFDTQEFFDGTGLVSATSSSFMTVKLPPCMAQVDAWYGLHPTTLLNSNPYGYPNIPWVLIYTHKYYQNSGGEITTSGPLCEKPLPPQCNPNINLIANGSFEEPEVTNSDLWDIFPSLTGWSLGWMNFDENAPEPSVELHRGVAGWLPALGSQHVELDGDWYGPSDSGQGGSTKLWQDLETVPGENYKLKFSFSPRPGTESSENVLGVLWGGSDVSGSPFSASGSENTVWTEYSLDIVATTTSTRLQFEDRGIENSLGTFLDNVSLSCIDENNGGGSEGEVKPFSVMVHKYIDGEQAVESQETSFPVSLSLGGSSFEGPLNSSNSFEYTLTNEQEHESLVVEEKTGDTDESLVLPLGGECSEGKYRLEGYSWGATLEEAEQKNEAYFSTDSNLNLTDVNGDLHVIIWNESCPKEEEESAPQNPEPDNEDENGRSGGGGNFSGSRQRNIGNLLSSSGSNGNGEVLGASTGPLCELYLNSYLKLGEENNAEEVKKLQIFLNQFFEVQNPVTGIFGPITFDMVKKFQAHQEAATLIPWKNAGLPTDGPTGYVYKTTKRWINILKCPELIATTPIPDLP